MSRQLITRVVRQSIQCSRQNVLRSLPAVVLAARPSAAARSLSTTAPRFESTPLTAKLQEEIQFEAENAEEQEPEFLRDFKAEGVWTIKDEPGADEIILTRTYGNENIRMIFSISDLDAEAPEADEYVEGAEQDTAAAADAGSGGVGEESAVGGPSEDSFPVEASITVTKAGQQGALTIDAVAQDGLFTISNISYYNDAELATGMSSEDDWKRQGMYMGPAFDNLDEGVQAEFENYLEERGINSSLALFIPDLAEYKEQKEYVQWLKSVNGFLQS